MHNLNPALRSLSCNASCLFLFFGNRLLSTTHNLSAKVLRCCCLDFRLLHPLLGFGPFLVLGLFFGNRLVSTTHNLNPALRSLSCNASCLVLFFGNRLLSTTHNLSLLCRCCLDFHFLLHPLLGFGPCLVLFFGNHLVSTTHNLNSV